MSNTLTEYDYFVPLEVTQGEAFVWKKCLDDFSPDDWTAQYRFRGAEGTGTGFNVNGTTDNGEYLFEATAIQTAACAAPARYDWQLWVTNSAVATETYQIESGSINIKRGFAAGTTTPVDNRSTAEQILEAIDATILSKATEDQLEYEISTPAGSRRLKRLSLSELKEAREFYAGIVNREKAAERIRNGGSLFKNHYVRLRSEGP